MSDKPIKITVTSLEQLANQLDDMCWAGMHWPGYVEPTRWQRTRWAISGYFSNLWAAICGKGG